VSEGLGWPGRTRPVVLAFAVLSCGLFWLAVRGGWFGPDVGRGREPPPRSKVTPCGTCCARARHTPCIAPMPAADATGRGSAN